MNLKTKIKSKSTTINVRNNRGKKIRRKSPKTIDYNKVVEKYGNLLETSINTSDDIKLKSSKINEEKDSCDSYYDYILDNIYNKEENKKENNNLKDNSNKEEEFNSLYYFTFKQKINDIKNNNNIYSSINNKKEDINNINVNMYRTFNNQLKKNKSKTNIYNKNIIDDYTKKYNYKILNSNNNKKINNIKSNNLNEVENNKNNILNITKNQDEKQYKNNIEEKKENINHQFKEKVILLLDLCRKYANKFNKLFPICEKSLINNKNNVLNNNSFIELKNTIIQYNNMIFNDGITKIFELENNNNNNILDYKLKEINEYEKKLSNLKKENQILKEKNKELILENKELCEQIINLKKLKYKNDEKNNTIIDLKNKIELLNNEIKNKDYTIKDLEGQINKNESLKKLNNINNILNQNKKQVRKEQINNEDKKDNNIYTDKKRENKRNYKLLDLEDNKPEQLNSEIHQLDVEIFNLKSKLKKIIQK